MLFGLLPYRAMLAARLALGGGVDHQSAQSLVMRTKGVVEVQYPIA